MNQQCRKTRSHFGPYLDGDLGPRAIRRVDGHLGDCPECRAELAAERQVADTFAGLPQLSCPARVDQKIMARLEETPREQSLLQRLGLILGSPGWKMVTACAAALVVVMLFLPVVTENPAGTESALNNGEDGEITHEEAYLARQRAKTSLAYVAHLIQTTEKETVNDVLTSKLPQAIRNSLQRVVPVKKEGSDS
jgi:predicted anti-sigma-YlaC factor YlaD